MATLEELELARAERGCENPPLDPNNIRKVKCKTCPFGDEPIGLELGQKAFNQLYTRLVEIALNESNQYCHAEELLGKVSTHVCRGARDIQLEYFYRIGVISEPTDEAWLKALQKNQYFDFAQ